MYLIFTPIFVTYLIIINFKEEQNNGILYSYVLNFKYRSNLILFKLTFFYCFSALFFTILLFLPSVILTITILNSGIFSYDYFIYLKFYFVILLYLILLVPIIFLFCFITSKLFALTFITFLSLFFTALYWILPLIPYTTNQGQFFLKEHLPYKSGYETNKLKVLDLSYIDTNYFLISQNQYYLDLLDSLEENNLDKNIKAFYQMSSYIINSPLINDENIINTFVQNVKDSLEYSNEEKVYNFIFIENNMLKASDFGIKLNINPSNTRFNNQLLIPLYRNGYLNKEPVLNQNTYVSIIEKQLLETFEKEKESNQLNNFLEKGEQLKLKFLEINNLIIENNSSFFAQYFSYLIINHSAFLRNIFNTINDTFIKEAEIQEKNLEKHVYNKRSVWEGWGGYISKIVKNVYFVDHFEITLKQLIDPYTLWTFAQGSFPTQVLYDVHKVNNNYYEYDFKTMAPNNKRSLIGTLTTLFVVNTFATWLLCYLFNRYKFMDHS
ncbi:hypothetical protein S100390_v1c09210 [Spiroplasma sp. NBRC 100390]|uniref:hypothetical protein n=1 Tax=unclassified Spiroplasma TaxID=2637901 RepID=UPI00089282B2|nr:MULTISPECIES: hypothetical protein [unclassified Spiroplasma]AOX44257.1 hypothetical protein STU14_v1c09210 [Spiroplasma sp. TU-14]APE13727.1 hypothetical protein S100390_v1c09210 [Spiroplasma sp. NBRC 100390]